MGKELGKGLSDLMGGSQGSRETSLWDGMGEGATSRNRGSSGTGVPGLTLLRRRGGRKGGAQEKEIRCCQLQASPLVFLLTHEP